MRMFKRISGFFNKMLFVDKTLNKPLSVKTVVVTNQYQKALDAIDYHRLSSEIDLKKIHGFKDNLDRSYSLECRKLVESVVAKELYSGRLNNLAISQLTEYIPELIRESYRSQNLESENNLETIAQKSQGFDLTEVAKNTARKYYASNILETSKEYEIKYTR